MIKASKKPNLMILGLSHENLKRLKGGEPIKFNMSELGLGNIDVFIFSGETESSMGEMMIDMTDYNHTEFK